MFMKKLFKFQNKKGRINKGLLVVIIVFLIVFAVEIASTLKKANNQKDSNSTKNTTTSKDIQYNPTTEFYINDFANILSDKTEQSVFNISRQIEQKTTAQLVVVTVPNMNGLTVEEYANNLYNKWGIGQKDKNNGVLLIISKSERKIRIEVGYGLEGAINDAKAGRILDNVAIPYLKNDDYDTAVTNVEKELQGIIYKEYNIEGGFDNYNNTTETESNKMSVESIIILIIAMCSPILIPVLLFLIFGKSNYNRWFGGGSRRISQRSADLVEAEASQVAVVILVEAVLLEAFRVYV